MTRADKAPPSFPLYYKDAYTDAAFVALPWEAQGLFWRLACWQWDDGDIPSDVEQIIVIVGKAKETRRAWPTVSALFAAVDDRPGRLRNPKVHDLREAMLDARRRKQQGAQNANAKRWGEVIAVRSDSDQMPIAKRSDTDVPLAIATRVANANATVSDPDVTESTEGVQGEPTPAPSTIDIVAAAARLMHKIEHCGLHDRGLPTPQIVTAWVTEYGEELVAETVHDPRINLAGKRWQYLDSILQDRKENPNERPGNRRRTDGRRPARDTDQEESDRAAELRRKFPQSLTLDDVLRAAK